MAIDFSKVPRDLHKTDPLLFSFLMTVDAVQFPIRFNGKYGIDSNSLPAFEYAVNSWQTVYDDGCKYWEQDVLTAIWSRKPESCKISWSEFPEGQPIINDKIENIDMSFKYPFEQWKINVFQQLDQIISSLTYKGARKSGEKKKDRLLHDIFGWEIVDDKISYVYATESDSDGIFGVGAIFRLRSPFNECCPKIDKNKISAERMKSLGFNLDNI